MPTSTPSPSFDLTGQNAFVSGTSRGLGERFALTLARAGADLVVTSRTLKSLESIVKRIEDLGRKALPLELDVRSLDSIVAAMQAAKAHYGKLDVLVCNAGCNVRKPAVDVTWDDWNLILDTNLRGSFFLAQQAAKELMIPAKYGRIILIGSVTCVAGYAGLAPYGASRGGVKQMAMALADDWGLHGITVNVLAPGGFKTAQNALMYEDAEWVSYLSDRIPLKRPGAMPDLDGPLLFLASEESRYVTAQTLLVDGGISGGATRALPKKK
jgi:NAD(P)-dependent dehydrogenase (short-subunit alcohol dehydrogenase family)